MSILSRTLPVLLACPLLLGACGESDAPDAPPADAPADAPVAAPGAQAPTKTTPGPKASAPTQAAPGATTAEPEAAPRWPTMNTNRPAPDGASMATLTDVRVGGHEGYDRVVFELSGPVGVTAAWSDEVIQCGSGRPVLVDGSAILEVKLGPARAHDDGGRATVDPRELRPDVPTIAHAVQTCDYEGQVRWALGLPEKTGMRVLQLEDPDRIVVDLQR